MWIRDTLDHAAAARVPLDFVSYHGYPTDKGLYERDQKIVYRDESYWARLSAEASDLVKRSTLPDTLIHVTEWNETPSSRDPGHDKVNAAPFMLKTIQEVVTLVVFALFTLLFFRHEPLRWNHLLAACCLVLAVWLVFRK